MTQKPDLAGFDALLRARHSCRGFLPDQLTQKVIGSIVQAAQRVPSWCNAQPWHLTITSGAETDRLRDFLFQAASEAIELLARICLLLALNPSRQ